MKLSAAVSDFGGQSNCRFGMRPLIRAFGVSMDASFHGGSMTPSAAASDPGGRRCCCLIVSTVFSPLSLTLGNNFSEKLFTGVNDTTDKFFGGVNDTGE